MKKYVGGIDVNIKELLFMTNKFTQICKEREGRAGDPSAARD